MLLHRRGFDLPPSHPNRRDQPEHPRECHRHPAPSSSGGDDRTAAGFLRHGDQHRVYSSLAHPDANGNGYTASSPAASAHPHPHADPDCHAATNRYADRYVD
jgi:hypothetical protein